MNLRQKRDRLIAETLQKILIQRFSQSLGGKSLVCLEGFSADVYKELKEMAAPQADVFWAGETRGEELIRMRNDPKEARPLVIFIGAYFPESQSLDHFSRITVQMILENENYRETLLGQAFYNIEHLSGDELVREAVKKMIRTLQPSLETMAGYLVSVRDHTPNERQGKNPALFYENMGKELWRLGVFSYQNLIFDNRKTTSTNVELLKASYETYLKHNLQYASPGYRSRFTYERLSSNELDTEQRKLLFDYTRNMNVDKCFQKVDFLAVKRLLKRPRTGSGKPANVLDTEKPEKDILEGIFNRFIGTGNYKLTFGDGDNFAVDLEPISTAKALEPEPAFNEWNTRLNEAIHKFYKQKAFDEASDEDNPAIEITVTVHEEKKGKRKEIFLLDLEELESNKTPTSIKDWNKLIEQSTDGDIKEAAKKFVQTRDEVLKEIKNPGFLTLPLDLESYIFAYLKLLIILWEKAANSFQFDWFKELLKRFVYLDMEETSEGELKIMPAHPFQLFKQRLKEMMILELLKKTADEDKKENRAEKDENGEKYNISELRDLMDEIFIKCWPRYFGKKEGKPPLRYNTGDEETRYKPRESYLPRKTMLSQTLNPQIEYYVKENPLAFHGIRLKVLNPSDGQELFSAINELYKKRNMLHVPRFIYLTAIGPNETETMSHFDNRVESMDKEEVDIFLKQHGRLLPFCRYEKQLIKEKDWMKSWLNDSKSAGDDVDIFFAVDPFWDRFEVRDDFMPTEESAAVDQYFQNFAQGNLKPLEFLAGPDRIYLRLALESLSIMVSRRISDRHKYVEEGINYRDYTALVKKMRAVGQWTIVQDHNINDYYAEELAHMIENETNQPVSTLIKNSSQGGIYLFITPSQEKQDKIETKWMPEHLEDNNNFQGWMATVYHEFIDADEFMRIFFESPCQWLIPLDLLPGFFIDFQPDDETAETTEIVSTKDAAKYFLRLVFSPPGEDDNIHFGTHIYKLEESDQLEEMKLKKAQDEIATDFSEFIKIEINEPYKIYDRLRRRSIYNVLLTLITNPYQAWFLALLNRENVNFSCDLKEEIPEIKDDCTGRLKIWELRRLTTHLIKLYSDNPGISFDLAHYLISFFNYIKKQTPRFLKRCIGHLFRKNPSLSENCSFLEDYTKDREK